MVHPNMLEAVRVGVVVVDLQEAFRRVVGDFEVVVGRTATMVRIAQWLGVPILVTEQVPAKLGRTAEELLAVFESAPAVFQKTAFGACGADGFVEALEGTGRRQILVAGLEAHICVNQTVHELLARGYQVHLLRDCITARAAADREAGIAKMQQAGAIASSVELAAFEMLRDAGHEKFHAVQRLIK